MKRESFLGLDLGGMGVKAGVFSAEGELLGFARVPFTPWSFAEGRVEIPIETIEEGARNAVLDAVRQSDSRVRAMAVSSQGQTFVSLDAQDRPLHPSIVWSDARAAQEVRGNAGDPRKGVIGDEVGALARHGCAPPVRSR